MGQAKQRGTREQRIAQARERDEQVPSLSRTCGSTSRDELLHRIIPIYQQMDARLAQSPVAIDCQAGCSYCCYYHVLVTPAEALALAEYISTLPDDARIAIQARLTATAARVAPLSQRDYITTNIPCAFLDAGRCSVYGARPIACRGFHSRDVAACQRAFDDPHCTDLHPYDAYRQHVHVRTKHDFALAHLTAGCEAAEYEMHGAVAAALADPAAFARWHAGTVSFPTVRDRTPVMSDNVSRMFSLGHLPS